MRRRLLLGIGILTVAAALALVVIPRPRSEPDVPEAGGPTQASLALEPAAGLQTPGSTEFAVGGHDAYWTMESGSTPAITWRRYGVHSSWDEIVSHFRAEMKARGWRDGGCSSGIKSTGEWAVEAWNTDDRILRLGHRVDLPPDQVAIGTYYSVALIGEGVPPGCDVPVVLAPG